MGIFLCKFVSFRSDSAPLFGTKRRADSPILFSINGGKGARLPVIKKPRVREAGLGKSLLEIISPSSRELDLFSLGGAQSSTSSEERFLLDKKRVNEGIKAVRGAFDRRWGVSGRNVRKSAFGTPEFGPLPISTVGGVVRSMSQGPLLVIPSIYSKLLGLAPTLISAPEALKDWYNDHPGDYIVMAPSLNGTAIKLPIYLNGEASGIETKEIYKCHLKVGDFEKLSREFSMAHEFHFPKQTELADAKKVFLDKSDEELISLIKKKKQSKIENSILAVLIALSHSSETFVENPTRINPLLYFLTSGYVVDDDFEGMADRKGLNIAVSNLKDVLCNAENVNNLSSFSYFNGFKGMYDSNLEINKILKGIYGRQSISKVKEMFLEEYQKQLDSTLLELEFTEYDGYVNHRVITGGYIVMIMVHDLLLGVPDFRKKAGVSHLIEELDRQIGKLIVLGNDTFSFEKELAKILGKDMKKIKWDTKVSELSVEIQAKLPVNGLVIKSKENNISFKEALFEVTLDYLKTKDNIFKHFEIILEQSKRDGGVFSSLE
jgi:hypothetical protein